MDWREEIIFLLENQQDFKCANVYDIKGNMVCFFDEKTGKELKEKLVRFLSNWKKGAYTIVFRKLSNHSLENGFKHYFDTKEVIEIVQAKEIVQGLPTPINDIDIETRIANGIEQGMKAIKLETSIKEVEATKKQLETLSGKGAIVLEQIITRLAPSFMPATQPIQGATLEVEGNATQEQLNNAVSILVEHLGVDNVVLIANKVKANPKQFLGYLDLM